MFPIVHLCPDYEILIKELCEHFFRELTPKLCHEVASCQLVTVFERWQVLGNSAHAEHIVMHNANLRKEKCSC